MKRGTRSIVIPVLALAALLILPTVVLLKGTDVVFGDTPSVTQRLHFTKVHNLSGLHDELMNGLPALRPISGVDSDGTAVQFAVLRVEGTGTDIWLTVPASLSQVELDLISAIVGAHDPAPAVSARDAAFERFLAGVIANKNRAPWGPILYDWAISEGVVTD